MDNEKVVLKCGSSWGIGTYWVNVDGVREEVYGYPPKGMNPHDYRPDGECCRPEEIANWERAKSEYKPSR